MNLYDHIGDASSSLRGSTSSFLSCLCVFRYFLCNIELQSRLIAHLFSKESKMNSLAIKQDPKYEEDFEDYFCEEEMKVCFVYLKCEDIINFR